MQIMKAVIWIAKANNCTITTVFCAWESPFLPKYPFKGDKIAAKGIAANRNQFIMI
jgi:hypothetical protein